MSENQTIDTFWDPASGSISRTDIAPATEALHLRLGRIQKNRNAYRLARGILLLVPFLATAAIVYFSRDPGLFGFGLMLGFLPYIILNSYIQQLQQDLTAVRVAESKGWLFSPAEVGIGRYHMAFPGFFNRGHSELICERWWGSVPVHHESAWFWHAEYRYVTGSGKSSHTYYEHLFAYKLSRPPAFNVTIRPENGFGKLFNRKDIDLESIEFNKLFSISYPGRREESASQVFRTLNPAVMAALLDLQKVLPFTRLAFQDNAVIISTPKTYRKSYSNILKQDELDQRDITQLSSTFTAIFNACSKVLEALD